MPASIRLAKYHADWPLLHTKRPLALPNPVPPNATELAHPLMLRNAGLGVNILRQPMTPQAAPQQTLYGYVTGGNTSEEAQSRMASYTTIHMSKSWHLATEGTCRDHPRPFAGHL